MRHVVMFSSGATSWAAAKRVAQKHGSDDLTMLFADTRMEDEDNYRFLPEAALNVGGRLVIAADGRDPWDVFCAITEPRRFHENEDHRQQLLSMRVTAARAALDAFRSGRGEEG